MNTSITYLPRGIIIDHNFISHCKAMDNYCELYFLNGRTKLLSTTLKSIEELLPKDSFLRVSKSYLINTREIAYIEINRKTVCLKNGTLIEIKGNRQDMLNKICKCLPLNSK